MFTFQEPLSVSERILRSERLKLPSAGLTARKLPQSKDELLPSPDPYLLDWTTPAMPKVFTHWPPRIQPPAITFTDELAIVSPETQRFLEMHEAMHARYATLCTPISPDTLRQNAMGDIATQVLNHPDRCKPFDPFDL
jgi:hypothetical protein